METLRIGNIEVIFEFNEPLEETGFISETFDFISKPAYATIGISEIVSQKTDVQPVIFEIFRTFRERAKLSKLDYLQKLSIEGEDAWCIDSGMGGTICLMKPCEY